jgi:hypothetical protein
MPTPKKPAPVLVDAETRRRANNLVFAVGETRALAMLSVGAATLEAARDRGRMRAATFDRFVASLTAAESLIAQKASA